MSAPEISLRFLMDAATFDEAAHYFASRAVQLLMDGFRWTHRLDRLQTSGSEWGVRTTFVAPNGYEYQSVYVYAPHRGRGHLSTFAQLAEFPFVTSPQCDIERYFRQKGIPYVLAGTFTLTREYQAIQAFYGNRRAERSGLFYMNHIDEGLAVLRFLNASDRAKRAWCLHPLVQADADLLRTYWGLDEGTPTEDHHVLLLAMEYRNVANAYLSTRSVAEIGEIALSPIEEVNDMLRADKVQNYKDFLQHHRNAHPRRAELDSYFQNWLQRLGISRPLFDEWSTRLMI